MARPSASATIGIPPARVVFGIPAPRLRPKGGIRHFLEPREAIHDRLRALQSPHWEEQIEKYPWLYGALGDLDADVTFVCENPSLSGLRAIGGSPFGGPPDIDTQWTGNPANRGDRRFRALPCGLGLKDGTIWEPGGWHCYIANVIEQAAVVGEWEGTSRDEMRQTARDWSGILQMETDAVRAAGIRAAALLVGPLIVSTAAHHSLPHGDEPGPEFRNLSVIPTNEPKKLPTVPSSSS